MAETTRRVLRLLGLLESRTTWQAGELAERLGVTERTVRRDVARLRDLGYPVDGERGVDGGYRLGAGRRLPPLLLDDDEAVALVACLRMAALGGTDSVGEAALRALTKLDHVLPPRLRGVAVALDEATQTLPRTRPAVDWTLLSGLATAQRDRCVVRFTYTRPDGEAFEREVEPARLATQGDRWYLQAFDRGRDDWRIFRLDRMRDLHVTTWRFAARDVPSLAFAGSLAGRHPCVVTVGYTTGVDAVVARIPAGHRGRLEEIPGGCRVEVGGGGWDELAWHLLWAARSLGCDLVLVEDDPGAEPLRDALRDLAGLAARTAS